MKKNLLPFVLLCSIAAVIAFSCKKSKTTTGPTKSLNQLFSDLRTTPQNFSVSAGRDTIVYATGGTQFHFYANSFKNAAGNIITSGTVNLQLTEMSKPGQMIQNRATTTAINGQPLMSGGQVNIIATMGAARVFANKYGIGFKQSGSSAQPMELFYGGTGNRDSIVTWTVGNNTTPGTTATSVDTITVDTLSFYYLFDSCTDFDYINCDHFTQDIHSVAVKIVFPNNSYTYYNTQAFFCFPSFNSVVAGSYLNKITDGVLNSSLEAPPIGTLYKFVAITNKNGNYYYYESSGTISTGAITINAAMAPETRGDIIDRITGL